MQAWFQACGLWRIVNGTKTKPVQPSTPTEADTTALEAWEMKSERAAGYLMLMVGSDQRVHFGDERDNPVTMWTALKAVHLQKWPGNRFNTYDELFSIRKAEDESLQSLINWVEDCMRRIKDLRPEKFDLKSLDEKLACMCLIRALPDNYSAFISSLLLKDKLDKSTIHQAFVTKDLQRQKRPSDFSTSTAFSATSQSFKSSIQCHWCSREGHIESQCNTKARARAQAQEKVTGECSERTERPEHAKQWKSLQEPSKSCQQGPGGL
jgi:hypothetical protein